MVNSFINDLTKKHDFPITPLRHDILSVILNNNGRMKAYDIIAKVSNIRGDTKPITVYRVLNFLVKKGILHKILSKNIFILCSDCTIKKHKENSIFLMCKRCNKIDEVHDISFIANLNKFYAQYNFSVSEDNIELDGYCIKCWPFEKVC